MTVDLGRDTNIGIPPAETQQVNVVISTPITNALKAQVGNKLDETNMRLATSHNALEFILDEEVPLGIDD